MFLTNLYVEWLGATRSIIGRSIHRSSAYFLNGHRRQLLFYYQFIVDLTYLLNSSEKKNQIFNFDDRKLPFSVKLPFGQMSLFRVQIGFKSFWNGNLDEILSVQRVYLK